MSMDIQTRYGFLMVVQPPHRDLQTAPATDCSQLLTIRVRFDNCRIRSIRDNNLTTPEILVCAFASKTGLRREVLAGFVILDSVLDASPPAMTVCISTD
jgi:hypothetical protein